jgi:hypothetical protein
MSSEQIFYLEVGHKITDSVESQMFGKPCFKINGKAFMSFFNNRIVFKLTGEKYEEALSLEGSELFDPSGKNRPMKEWVQVSFNDADRWYGFACDAFEYVKSQTKL